MLDIRLGCGAVFILRPVGCSIRIFITTIRRLISQTFSKSFDTLLSPFIRIDSNEWSQHGVKLKSCQF